VPDRAYPDAAFPADPYPGTVPPFSFVHLDGCSRPLTVDGRRLVDGVELDTWLVAHGAPPLAGRVPVLAYGSNRNPAKMTWLRRALGLTGPVVVLRARTAGLAAVWASGFRARDGQRTSVLAAAPGASEQHALWLATPDQVAVLDRCEGRGDRYRLARLGTGRVHTEDGTPVAAPWCYLGLSAARRPLLVGGRTVRCADLDQTAARTLHGGPAPDDGLAAVTVEGAPHPDEWPDALFLDDGPQPGWPLPAGDVVGRPRRAVVAEPWCGAARGRPAPRPGGRRDAPGWLVALRDPVSALHRLDHDRGPARRRIRVTATTDGNPQATPCWIYRGAVQEAGFRPPARPGGGVSI
jgi:hypothetical protein